MADIYEDILNDPAGSTPSIVGEPATLSTYSVARRSSFTTLRSRFMKHYEAWMDETGPNSNSSIIRSNQHFREIVKMGKEITPYIIEMLKQEPSHLTWALTEIYSETISTTPISNSEACRKWIEKFEK